MSNTVKFVCTECNYSSLKWLGRCPECGSWNTFVEEKVTNGNKTTSKDSLQTSSCLLSEVQYDKDFRFSSGISELDRVLGGGIVSASAILVGGEPGIGKSTLLIQVAANCSARRSVLYISGEESGGQIRQRAERLGLELTKINILCETKLEKIKAVVEKEKPQLVILDSLQTLTSENLSSHAGTVTQIRYGCLTLTECCKEIGSSIFFVAHVTKEGTIAGPKVIEHMVDTVVYFEQASMGVRLVRTTKNRFGSVDEIGIFTMTNKGLEPVSDPSAFFISERNTDNVPPGIAYSAVIEGSRTFMVEIQALVIDAKTGSSRVYSDKVDTSRVTRIAAILERHTGVKLADKDIYVNVAGDIKVDDVCIELAIAQALWSATYNVSIPNKICCFGELSLAGEIRPVSYPDKLLKSAYEMGFKRAFIPSMQKIHETNLNVTACKKIQDVFVTENS